MKRQVLIAGVGCIHLLAAGILLLRTGVVAFQTGSPEVGAGAMREIWIQTAMVSVPALLLLVGAAGLMFARSWGWRAAAAADAILLALVGADWLLGGQHVDHVPVLAVLAILMLALFVPQVRALQGSVGEGDG